VYFFRRMSVFDMIDWAVPCGLFTILFWPFLYVRKSVEGDQCRRMLLGRGERCVFKGLADCFGCRRDQIKFDGTHADQITLRASRQICHRQNVVNPSISYSRTKTLNLRSSVLLRY
jgi:hypothetical protein